MYATANIIFLLDDHYLFKIMPTILCKLFFNLCNDGCNQFQLVKGRQTGCGPHGYSPVSFHHWQVNIVSCTARDSSLSLTHIKWHDVPTFQCRAIQKSEEKKKCQHFEPNHEELSIYIHRLGKTWRYDMLYLSSGAGPSQDHCSNTRTGLG